MCTRLGIWPEGYDESNIHFRQITNAHVITIAMYIAIYHFSHFQMASLY